MAESGTSAILSEVAECLKCVIIVTYQHGMLFADECRLELQCGVWL